MVVGEASEVGDVPLLETIEIDGVTAGLVYVVDLDVLIVGGVL
jgi:hypothetical protein